MFLPLTTKISQNFANMGLSSGLMGGNIDNMNSLMGKLYVNILKPVGDIVSDIAAGVLE